MSLYFKALPWMIPQVLLTAQPRTQVAIVSPWMADVTLESPVLYHRSQNPRLSSVLNLLLEKRIAILLVVRERDFRLKGLLKKLPKSSVQVINVDHIHTKAVITEDLVLTTSGNLLETSLYRNRENINLTANQYKSSQRWLEFEQEIRY